MLALAVGIFAQSVSRHLRIPEIVLLLLAGACLGPDGLAWIDPIGAILAALLLGISLQGIESIWDAPMVLAASLGFAAIVGLLVLVIRPLGAGSENGVALRVELLRGSWLRGRGDGRPSGSGPCRPQASHHRTQVTSH